MSAMEPRATSPQSGITRGILRPRLQADSDTEALTDYEARLSRRLRAEQCAAAYRSPPRPTLASPQQPPGFHVQK
jgi:hypothetical protein